MDFEFWSVCDLLGVLLNVNFDFVIVRWFVIFIFDKFLVILDEFLAFLGFFCSWNFDEMI